MEFIGKTLAFTAKLLLFIALSIIFLPSFVIVNYLQKPWAELLESLFG